MPFWIFGAIPSGFGNVCGREDRRVRHNINGDGFSSSCTNIDWNSNSSITITISQQRSDTMSMDLAVWSTRDFNFPAELPRSTLWKHYDEEFAFEEDQWQ